MNNDIFREKSLKKISSPENLNEYVKVANPGIWVLLAGVIALLIGFIAWGYFGRIDTVITSYAIVNNNKGITYLKEEKINDLKEDSFIMIDDVKFEIVSVDDMPTQVNSSSDSSYMHIAEIENGDWVYCIEFFTDLEDGLYTTKIVTESVKPISLLFD